MSAEVVVLPTHGLLALEASLRRYLAAKAEQQQALQVDQQVNERLAYAFGSIPVDTVGITFDFSPVGAGE